MHKLVTGQFAEASSSIARPRMEDIPRSKTLLPWKTYTRPQLDRVLLGPMHNQLQKPCLKPKRTDQSLLVQFQILPHCEDRSITPDSSNPKSDGHPLTSYKELNMGTALPHFQN